MSFQDIEIRIDQPYPEIVNVEQDAQTIAVLKNLATSKVGELNAVLQYIYQAVISHDINEDISSVFEEIGIVEMMHLDMLMHAIRMFGGVPRYEDSNGNLYNVSAINYSLKLKDMLTNNIKAEKEGIEAYKRAKNIVKNQSLKDLFDRFILDEQKHLEIFNKILNTVTFMSV